MSAKESIIVVQMHGEPGSGKSTVARALAPRINAIALDKDIIKSALLGAGALEPLAASGAYEAYFDLARDLVEQGYSLVLDNPVYWLRVEARWLEVSAAMSCPPLLIECVCPDPEALLRRLRSRNGLESQPRDPLDLKRHPGSAPTSFQPRITLDTTRPIDELIEEAVTYINHRISAAAVGAAR